MIKRSAVGGRPMHRAARLSGRLEAQLPTNAGSFQSVLFLSFGLLLGGCRTPAAPTSGSEAPTAALPAMPAAPVPSTIDFHSAYDQCRERVEGPEADGECTSDADCQTGGCSGEVCATAASMEGYMGTCEVLPCFSILKSCGCIEGRCSWTVGAPDPLDGAPAIVLPPRSELPGAAPATPTE